MKHGLHNTRCLCSTTKYILICRQIIWLPDLIQLIEKAQKIKMSTNELLYYTYTLTRKHCHVKQMCSLDFEHLECLHHPISPLMAQDIWLDKPVLSLKAQCEWTIGYMPTKYMLSHRHLSQIHWLTRLDSFNGMLNWSTISRISCISCMMLEYTVIR